MNTAESGERTVLESNNNVMMFHEGNLYNFTPTDNITAKELARVLQELRIQVAQDNYEIMPAEVKKHFKRNEQ